MKKIFLSLTCFFLSIYLMGQDLSALKFRELGPYRGGRVTAVAGTVMEPGTFYMGATGGGVWKTIDYGITWKNVSDGFLKTPSIGAIAVAQNDPNIVYVGTGSDAIRSNVIEGKGVYKSINGGKSWEYIGLENVGQIGSLIIHPTDHNTVYIGAMGKAFSPNTERGLYKTADGGKSWKKVLSISEKIGICDVEFMPTNPNILYAATWETERKPWTIESGGSAEKNGVYKSIDAGNTWTKVSLGLPGSLVGKIDLAVTPADSKIVYALIEASGSEGGVYKSNDQAESFSQVSNKKGLRTRPFYYTNIKVDPTNADRLYVLATGYYFSDDGGLNWNKIGSPHGDNHDMWINPSNPDIFIQSNDGGANVTMNGGKSWSTQFNQPTAELYQVNVDDQYPYWLYAGQQDNYSTIAVPSQIPYSIQQSSSGYIINTGGCETGPAVPKPGNANIVYSNCKGRFVVFDKLTGMQQSYYVGGHYMYGHNPAELKYRFQRVSPIHVSPHDPNVVYHCSQYVHRTTDEGKTWETISPDLTAFESNKQVISGSPITRDITGEEFYSTIYSIQESPVQKGLIWVGANDGPIHVTQDNGETWTNVTPKKTPLGGRVDAVEPSPHKAGKAYTAVLRYQLGDPNPYIYKTKDFGKTWTLISLDNGIPADAPVRVIREDPKLEGLLYAGTEYGLYVSYDDGESWKSFQQNLPITPITDIKIHRDDLVLSTMGRGFWILDNGSIIRQLVKLDTQNPTLFKPKNTVRYRRPYGTWNKTKPSYPSPGVLIDYHLPEQVSKLLKLEILDQNKEVIATYVSDTTGVEGNSEVLYDMNTNETTFIVHNLLTKRVGLNRFKWDMHRNGPWSNNQFRSYQNGPLVPPGLYYARLTVADRTFIQNFQLISDPRVKKDRVTPGEIEEQQIFLKQVIDLLSNARKMEAEIADELNDLNEKESMSADEQTVFDRLTNIHNQLQTLDGTYMKPMLIEQIEYLYNMVNRADQVPGKDAIIRYEELKSQFDEINKIR